MGQQNSSYKTGNKKLDAKIEMSLKKDPSRPSRLIRIMEGEQEEKQNKYNVVDKAERTYKDGTIFASKGEMLRWDDLLMLQRSGQIKNLRKQVPYILQEGFISKQWGEIKPIIYVADFVYINISYRKGYEGREVVEDSKGKYKKGRTKVYKVKRKRFLHEFGDLLFFEV